MKGKMKAQLFYGPKDVRYEDTDIPQIDSGEALGACLGTEILKLLQQHVVFDNITYYCMWYLKNLDSHSRTSS